MRVAKRFVMWGHSGWGGKKAWTEVEPLIENSDIVVFSLPPDTKCKTILQKWHIFFRPGQVVTDVYLVQRKTLYELYMILFRKDNFLCLFILWLALKRVATSIS